MTSPDSPSPERPLGSATPEHPLGTPGTEHLLGTPDPEQPLDAPGPARPLGTPGPEQPPGTPGPERPLAERQAALVAALVAGAPVPPGFDPVLIEAARKALLRKRAGDVARHWPLLAASFGARWPAVFATWAASRPTQGPLRDGWDLARSLPLTGPAAEELAAREANRRPRLLRLIRNLAGTMRGAPPRS